MLLAAAALLRPILVTAHCDSPEALDGCTEESLPALDQWGLQPLDRHLDSLSTFTQNAAGALVFGTPLVQSGYSTLVKGITAAATAPAVLSEWLLLAEAAAWNAAINEWIRMGVQRPRPLLLTAREEARDKLRKRIGNYNSFYSGHTSFAVLAATLLISGLWARRTRGRSRVERGAAVIATLAAIVLAAGTGLLRVAAGRHYPTDVIAGAAAGAVIAWLLRKLQSRPAFDP